MNFKERHKQKIGALLLVIAAVIGFIGVSRGDALATTLPATTGTLAGSTRTFDLYAKAGTSTLPGGATVAVWGYTFGAGDTLTFPGGPALIVNQGETVVVNLHNTLTEASSILFQGQGMVPDTTGAAAGGAKSYTFTAANPGTFLYEAGLLANAQHQAAMGLYGALIVRPTSAGTAILTQAYANAATTFVDEALLVLSEIDPALNGSSTPAAFDMRNYAPKYFLINGKAYPATDPIPSSAGNALLLRYVNAGIKNHSMAALGLRQNFVAKDGSLLPTLTHNVVAESLAPGQTGDAIATIPSAATSDSKFAVYDGNLMLHNNGGAGFGGMLTFVTAGTGTVATGPTTSATTLTPNPSNGSVSVGLSASISSSSSTVTAAEYFIDTTSGTGTAMGGLFGSATANVNATLSTALLASLGSGNHTLYVHGQDATGKWGALNSAVLNLDKAGPVTSALTLTPNPSNGTANLALSATGDDRTTGNSNIAAAEYAIDGGSAVPMAVSTTGAPVASLTATISAATVNALSAGPHSISVRSRDSLGNWGAFVPMNLLLDKAGPAASLVNAVPNPNNGRLPLNSSSAVVRVTASFSDTTTGNSNIAAAEGFIDTVGANGTGFPFVASDGSFNSTAENGYADIPLTTIYQLSAGNHNIYVHGKDATGNWGATGTTVLLIDKTAPTLTGITLAPNPTLGATSVTLTVIGAADPLVSGLASGVAGGEYWIGTTAPAVGAGTYFTGLTVAIPVGTLATGTYTIGARVRDAAGNWSSITSVTLVVVPDAIFSNGFETGSSPWGWSSASTNSAARLNVAAAAALVGTLGLQAQGNNTNYVQYNFGTAASPATGTFDARFYFNPNNNASTGQDIFAGATSNAFGTQLFHVRYRRNGTQPQVQIQVGATANAAWVNVNNNASNRIEVVWQSGATLQLYVNGALSQTLTAGAGSVAAVRLGSVTSGGSNTLEFFDAFASKRSVSPLLGP